MFETTTKQIEKELLEDLLTSKDGETEAMKKFGNLLKSSLVFNSEMLSFVRALVPIMLNNDVDGFIALIKGLANKYFAHGYNVAISQMVKDE